MNLCACGCGLPAKPELGAFVDYRHGTRYEANGRRAEAAKAVGSPGQHDEVIDAQMQASAQAQAQAQEGMLQLEQGKLQAKANDVQTQVQGKIAAEQIKAQSAAEREQSGQQSNLIGEIVKQAVVDANAAEMDLVRAIDAASDALDKVAINPLAGSLARLEASAVAAHERLQAGRDHARQVLGRPADLEQDLLEPPSLRRMHDDGVVVDAGADLVLDGVGRRSE